MSSQRTVVFRLPLLMAALTAALAATGCGGYSSESCDQYLLCVSATVPLSTSEQLSLYGKDGTCWKQIEPEQCARACKAGLKALAQTTTAKECHPPKNTLPGVDPSPNMSPPVSSFSWQLPTKSMYYGGTTQDLGLGGEDPITHEWRCMRDDTDPNPPSAIARMGEPNDSIEQAIVLPNPLPVDPPVSIGAAYQICPDRSAPNQPDVDVFKFKLASAAHVIAEIKYEVAFGDLDMAVFRDAINPVTGAHEPTPVSADLSPVSNACVEAQLTNPGTYYVLVWGARFPEHPTTTAMNNYQLRVFSVQASGYSCH